MFEVISDITKSLSNLHADRQINSRKLLEEICYFIFTRRNNNEEILGIKLRVILRYH